MSSTSKISTVTTLRAPLDLTLSFVRYHLNSGIDHMYLFFDDPDDDAIPFLEDEPRVDIFRCDDQHWKEMDLDSHSSIYSKQETNATLAFKLSKNSGYGWIIHLDNDELIYGPTSISDYLNGLSENISVVKFQVKEALPQKIRYDNPFSGINYFKVYDDVQFHPNFFSTKKTEELYQRIRSKSWRLRKKIAHQLGSKHASLNDYVYGHIKGKSAVRTTVEINSFKPHFPIPKNGLKPRISISRSFYILHYDCLGFENWKIKWTIRVQNNLWTETISSERLNLHNKIKIALEGKESAENLYKELYHLKNYERLLLKSLGLLKKFEIKEDIFKKLQ